MKALFLIFHGFEEHNGITKKIRCQIEALKSCGVDTHICYLTDENDRKCRMIDDTLLRDYGTGWRGKILKRTEFDSIIKYIGQNKIDFVYIRYNHNANPFILRLLRRIKELGCKIALEIPTYPYDAEYRYLPLSYQHILLVDRCFRQRLSQYIDKVVTFTKEKQIFGTPTIQISNGISFDKIRVKQNHRTPGELHLIGVATMHPWHGFDRAIAGMAAYSKQPYTTDVFFHIVGGGVPEVVREYKELVAYHQLQERVIFHGTLYGDSLDAVFEQADIGIASLARHRSGILHIKTLKNREYAARGVPFVYSEMDADFDEMPYVLKVPANDSPLDINSIVQFFHTHTFTPNEIRNSIVHELSWEKQMKQVIDEIYNL